jgi:hypothetical protein
MFQSCRGEKIVESVTQPSNSGGGVHRLAEVVETLDEQNAALNQQWNLLGLDGARARDRTCVLWVGYLCFGGF